MNVEAQRAELGEGMRKSFVFTMTGMVPDKSLTMFNCCIWMNVLDRGELGVDGYAYNDEKKHLS